MTNRWLLFFLVCLGITFYWLNTEQKRLAGIKLKRLEAARLVDAAKLKEAKKVDPAKEANKADLAKDGRKEPALPKAAEKPKDPVVDAGPKKGAEKNPLPEKTLMLGLDQEDGPFRIVAMISTKGAVVRKLDLLPDAAGVLPSRFTLLQSSSDSFRVDLKDESLANRNWEYVEKESAAPKKLVFRTLALEGKLEVVKRFTLEPDAYLIGMQLEFRNLGDVAIDDLRYEMTGGNDLPIEGTWYNTYFRRAVALLTPQSAGPYVDEQYATTITTTKQGQLLETTPIRFAGTAIQYFASVVIQEPPSTETRLIRSVQPYLAPPILGEMPPGNDPNFSNIGVTIGSEPIRLAPKAAVAQQFQLFNGPKKRELLDEERYKKYDLDKLIVYMGFMGMRFDLISHKMVSVLNWLYSFTGDYGVAIILLTVLVRLCLFPLSFFQAMSMQKMQHKMQIIQPKMEELKKRHTGDTERLNRELMELYRKHDYSPFSMLTGCLPVFLQMPIFIGLYQALQGSFDLRQTPMHHTWIKDLAAPDQLWKFPAPVPWLGPYFNLLPIISIIQMVLQMRMMAPTATTPEMKEQQRVQQQMTLFMMVFMGFAFYKVPAGLCVYIIVSSTWAMLERLFLPKPPKPAVNPIVSTGASGAANGATRDVGAWKTPLREKKKKKR